MIWLVIPIHFIQFVKFWSSWSFVKSRWLWVRRTHMMGFSPSFLGGSGGFLKTGMLEDAWNSDMKTWRHEIQTLEGCIKLQLYCENHVTLKERQRDTSIMQPYEQKVEWYFLIFLVVLLELTSLANIATWQVVNMAHTWSTIINADSWSNENSRWNLAEKPANFAGCQLLYTRHNYNRWHQWLQWNQWVINTEVIDR